MRRLSTFLLTAAVLLAAQSAIAQRDAGSKIRGEYNFNGSAATRSMQGARDYARDYREYAQSAPKVSPEVAKETSDSIGQYIAKAQKHMAWMRKQAAGDKETLTALDSIDKKLAAAATSHVALHECCVKDNVDAKDSMKCCKEIDDSLSKAISEHDTLMKRLATVTKK